MVRVFRVSGIHVRIELDAVSARKAPRRPVDATSAIINIGRVSDRKTYIKRSGGGEEKEKERKGGRRSL